ncbi:signal peptidase II [Jiangella asiatica]|uniref:Lipoprotein signal peptidase n=1 Tax=Jiangella asiatica TaxID=2530372 RepID=A0A4R5CCM5_9ACTN|nr:signal peptidase II [Jiangella asiatica]TDD97751.1 signal peptidase II [Jiangella asiatica]
MQAAPGASLTHDGTDSRSARAGVLLVVAAGVLALDQVTKILAVTQLEPGRAVPVIGDLVQLRLIRNPGAAFSLATNLTPVLTAVAIAVVMAIVWISRRVRSRAWAVALGGVLGGALGTLSDRMFRMPGPFRGHVVDFVELPNWPVFNVADSAIVAGAVVVAVLSLRGIPHDGAARRRRAAAVPERTGAA